MSDVILYLHVLPLQVQPFCLNPRDELRSIKAEAAASSAAASAAEQQAQRLRGELLES